MKNSKKITEEGFTLIELLVVIAVIGMLLAIMLPALKKAKGLAKRVVCGSNQRQITLAALTYAESNDGYLNYSSNHGLWDNKFSNPAMVIEYPADNDKAYWGVAYVEYTQGKKVFHCPSHRRVDDWPEWGWDWGEKRQEFFYYCSYGLNGYLSPRFPSQGGPERPKRVSDFRLPAELIFIQDHIEQRLDGVNSDMFCIAPGSSNQINLTQWRPRAEGGSGLWDAHWQPYDTVQECFRHDGKSVLAFLDGSSRVVKETTGEDIPVHWYLPQK